MILGELPPKARVGIKNGVSKHGFALNVDIDHRRFSKHIVPCGLKDRGVMNLQQIAAASDSAMPSREDIIDMITRKIATSF
jgi:lipoate-protein ligase B